MVSHQCRLSAGLSLIGVVFRRVWPLIGVVFRRGGLSSVCSFVGVVSHRCGLSSGLSHWCGFSSGLSHRCGLSSGWSHRCGLSSGLSHRCGLSSGLCLVTAGSTVLQELATLKEHTEMVSVDLSQYESVLEGSKPRLDLNGMNLLLCPLVSHVSLASEEVISVSGPSDDTKYREPVLSQACPC